MRRFYAVHIISSKAVLCDTVQCGKCFKAVAAANSCLHTTLATHNFRLSPGQFSVALDVAAVQDLHTLCCHAITTHNERPEDHLGLATPALQGR